MLQNDIFINEKLFPLFCCLRHLTILYSAHVLYNLSVHFNAMKHGQFNNVLKYEKIFGAQIFDERYLQAMLLGKNTQISFVLFDCFYYRLVLK